MSARGALLQVLRRDSLSKEQMLVEARDVVHHNHMGRAQLRGVAEALGVHTADSETVSDITKRLVDVSFSPANKPEENVEEDVAKGEDQDTSSSEDRQMRNTALNREPPPPSYDAARPGAAVGDAPPTYESLYGKIRATRQQSSGPLEFLRKAFTILCGTVACTIIAILVLGIPIAMIVVGGIHKNDCQVQKLIPIYLIVGGSVGLVRNLFCVRKTRHDENDEDDGMDKGGILDVFLFAWLIAGSVWVYKNWEPNYEDKMSPNYCNETTYKLAFAIITASWSLMALVCCCGCCIAVWALNV